jgi:hypothetical protein
VCSGVFVVYLSKCSTRSSEIGEKPVSFPCVSCTPSLHFFRVFNSTKPWHPKSRYEVDKATWTANTNKNEKEMSRLQSTIDGMTKDRERLFFERNEFKTEASRKMPIQRSRNQA